MIHSRRFSVLLSAILLGLVGCQYIDTTPLPTGNQVLSVTVGWPTGVTLPADASITVLLLDSALNDVALNTQTIAQPGAQPVAFQLAYKAEDLRPPHHVRVEARASAGGRPILRSNRQKNFVTPDSAAQTFAVMLEPLAGGAGVGAVAGSYAVKAGDTGASIAQQTGVPITELAAANPGVDWSKLKVGQKLKLPVTQ